MIKGKILPQDYFLTRDSQGEYHWYGEDPLKSKDRAAVEVSIEDIISNTVGWGTIANPVMVRLNCAKVDRSVEFNVGLLARIRKGEEDRHFEDMAGNVIDVLEVQNSDKEFPLTGVVFNSLGDVVETRKYSYKGDCKDGDETHHLMAMNGQAVFENDIDK